MSIQSLIPVIEQNTGKSLDNCNIKSLGGGDINAAYHCQAVGISWFVKVNRPNLSAMFEAEAAGLKELASTGAIRIPEVIAFGNTDQYSYLVLEHIALGRLNSQGSADFGHQLASLHRIKQPFFGWHIANTIGSTPQYNKAYDDWVSFWREQRLLKQLELAANNGYRGKLQSLGDRLAAKLDVFFDNYQPQASLLHGDLWGGNAAADSTGQPVIYDPACYYGDREADLAMTELFGGFSATFYQGYQEEWPLDPGYSVRKTLYNLYHIINHLNLFGSSYQHQAEAMMSRLLAET